MMDTPIFDVLRVEMTAAPLCQACGKPDLVRHEHEHWLLCTDCWMRGYGLSSQRKRSTCVVCGEFPLAWDNSYTLVRGTPDIDGCLVDVLCRNHFEEKEKQQ